MNAQFGEATMVVFSSTLETWGLPISEAKIRNKPLLVADLPYAHETVGTYAEVEFLPPNEPESWAKMMTAVIDGDWHPSGSTGQRPVPPFVEGWSELWRFLIRDL